MCGDLDCHKHGLGMSANFTWLSEGQGGPLLASESLRAIEEDAGSEFQEAMLSQESELTWSQYDGV